VKYVMIGRMEIYTGDRVPEEYFWEFGEDGALAREMHQMWSGWMEQSLHEFRRWNWHGAEMWIKPYTFYELDLRVVPG
jgi:hypothetical protein